MWSAFLKFMTDDKLAITPVIQQYAEIVEIDHGTKHSKVVDTVFGNLTLYPASLQTYYLIIIRKKTFTCHISKKSGYVQTYSCLRNFDKGKCPSKEATNLSHFDNSFFSKFCICIHAVAKTIFSALNFTWRPGVSTHCMHVDSQRWIYFVTCVSAC